ncbi:MAG: hypothetical protein ACREX3_01595 [Gammaproteobacteria bacterium]
MPLSCIKQGRWHFTSREFASSKYYSPSRACRKHQTVEVPFRSGGLQMLPHGVVPVFRLAAIPRLPVDDICRNGRTPSPEWLDGLLRIGGRLPPDRRTTSANAPSWLGAFVGGVRLAPKYHTGR